MPQLITQNLHWRYRDANAELLNDINLTFDSGMMTGILGPNGSGKTTLLQLLCGHFKPDSGKVLLDDHNVSTLSSKALSRLMALVPQQTELSFAFHVREVVLMGRNPHLPRFQSESAKDIEIAEEAMRRTRVAHLADRPVTRLSGGECQRVMIARALAQQTKVLLLDEPVSNLDVRHQVEILALCRHMADEGMMVVCVLHDLNMAARFCHRLVLLNEGEICAQGTPRDVLLPDILENVYGVPLRRLEDPLLGMLVMPM